MWITFRLFSVIIIYVVNGAWRTSVAVVPDMSYCQCCQVLERVHCHSTKNHGHLGTTHGPNFWCLDDLATPPPPPFRHCESLTRTIRHCYDSSQECFRVVTPRPPRSRGQTIRPLPYRSVWPLKSRSKCWLWQSERESALYTENLAILWSA